MSSAHNLPGMVATPHFTKKIGELGLRSLRITIVTGVFPVRIIPCAITW